MPDSIWTVVLSASVASLTTLIGFFVNSWVIEGRERRQHFQQQESERALALEERAGIAVELVHSISAGKEPDAELREVLKQLMLDSGRFRRYSELSVSIRNLYQAAMWVVREKLACGDFHAAGKDMHEAFLLLLQQIKALRAR
jgi:hypothetical protein